MPALAPGGHVVALHLSDVELLSAHGAHAPLTLVHGAFLRIGELAEMTPNPGSPASTKAATESIPTEKPNGEPVKDDQGIEVTPP